ncbi:MAG: metallophosphoesterase family protein [Syntrophomonadaceae bacterium]|jgi:Icc-related predicted phosphoesterase
MRAVEYMPACCQKYFKYGAIMVTALTGALLFVYLFGPMVYDFKGLALKICTLPSIQGKTIMEIPPFGSIGANTHQIPFELRVRIEYIGTSLASNIFDYSDNQPALLKHLRENVFKVACLYILRQALVGFLGASLLVLAIWRTRFRTALLYGLVPAMIITGILLTGVSTYSIAAFDELEYNGVISLAPSIIATPGELMDRLEEMQENTRLVVGNMQALVDNVDRLSFLGSPEKDPSILQVLLISDLHSNPVGIEFIKGLATSFGVDLIIDAGDLTDFGSPLETKVTEGLNQLEVPYVFCPGNHDTPEIINYIMSLKNGVVLDDKMIEIKGLKILGSPDPLSTSNVVEAKDPAAWKDMSEHQVASLKAIRSEQGAEPDLLVIHNPEIGRQLIEYFPLIINGHTHKQSIETYNDSLVINPGTSGAAGMRGLYSESSIPYSAIILHIKPGNPAVSADIVNYDPLADRFFVERKLLQSQSWHQFQESSI